MAAQAAAATTVHELQDRRLIWTETHVLVHSARFQRRALLGEAHVQSVLKIIPGSGSITHGSAGMINSHPVGLRPLKWSIPGSIPGSIRSGPQTSMKDGPLQRAQTRGGTPCKVIRLHGCCRRGHDDPDSARRATGYRLLWDVLHPVRTWADSGVTAEDIAARIVKHLVAKERAEQEQAAANEASAQARAQSSSVPTGTLRVRASLSTTVMVGLRAPRSRSLT